jgi:hypothetical protein
MEATLLASPDEIDPTNHQLAWQYSLINPPKRGLQYQDHHHQQIQLLLCAIISIK